MNKKGGVISSLIFFILLIGGLVYVTYNYAYPEYQRYETYKDFCEDKPNFCYCKMGICEYRVQWNSVTGLSKDAKELCKLAKSFEDKRTLFAAGCDLE